MDDLEHLDSEECNNYSTAVEITPSITEELSDVGTMATIIKELCVQGKAIGSLDYEYTSSGVEVFIKEEPLTLEDVDSKECENYSKAIGVTSSITETLVDVGTTSTTIKKECLQDSYNNEGMQSHVEEQCETVYAAENHLILQASKNNPREEFILPDVIDNIHAIEEMLKKEPVSCEETTEASKESSSEVNLGPISLKEELGIFSTDAADQASGGVLNPGMCEEYKLGDFNSEDCKTCGNKIRNMGECRHTLIHTLPHQCNICGRNFSFLSILRRHMHSHMDERAYVCNECGKNYKRKEALRRHMLIHNHPHQCENCKMSFTHLAKLKVHMSKHTGENPYQCTLCEERFRAVHKLVIHMRIHTGEKPFPCTLCEKRFGKKYLLVKHMHTHAGEKPYPCTVCGKRCSRKDNLVEHMRVHTGEMPYSCTLCEQRFSLRKALLEHMRAHTGDKPYHCTVCEKRYSRKEYLVQHMRMHTGEKPYQCTVCKKCFSIKKSLVEHMRIHTGVKPFQCTVCEKYFRRKGDLLVHVRTHTK